jgi:hypothetical protein
MRQRNPIRRLQVIGNGGERTNTMSKAFEPVPALSEPGPDHLRWTCPTCGVIEPLWLPTDRWIRRSCACERALRNQQREAEALKKWQDEVTMRVFEGWLGQAWEDAAIVKELRSKTFASYDRSFDQFQHISIVQQLTEISLLFIDDVDKVRPTDARQDLWFLIADQRYKAKRATILSTNKFDHLGHYIGEAALSRLQRNLVQVEMIGMDYREVEE